MKISVAHCMQDVCKYRAGAFDVRKELQTVDARLNGENEGHPDIGAKIADGWQVLTL